MTNEKYTKRDTLYGIVDKIEDDFTTISLYRDPERKDFVEERYFETPFLNACGLDRAGQTLALVFSTIVERTYGTVKMSIIPSRRVGKGLPTITVDKLNLELIDKKFGEHC